MKSLKLVLTYDNDISLRRVLTYTAASDMARARVGTVLGTMEVIQDEDMMRMVVMLMLVVVAVLLSFPVNSQ